MKALFSLLTILAMSAQTPALKLIEGDPASPVRILVYEDLQCPDCANFRKMMDTELIPRFKDKIAFEHRDFPIAKHAWARPAAIAANYFRAISPALAIEFRKVTLSSQESITAENFKAHLTAFAQAHKTDPEKAIASLSDRALDAEVESSYREGVARGIARTPTVLVNGDPFIETFQAADIIRSIERELAIANSKVAKP